MKTSDYKNLIAWQKAMELAIKVYALAKTLPKEERYVLSDQLRRAAISVPSNIAEGQGRESKKEFIKFLSIARGSLCEVETQLILGIRLGYFAPQLLADFNESIAEVGRLIKALATAIKNKWNPPPQTDQLTN